MAPAFVSTLKAFYRSCLFQIILVGLVSLSGPGIWMALNSLGAGGQASVSIPLPKTNLPGLLLSSGISILDDLPPPPPLSALVCYLADNPRPSSPPSSPSSTTPPMP